MAAEWVRSPDEVAYRHVRDNVTQWASGIPGLDEVVVPACPEWTVRQLVAHLVEICWKVAARAGMVDGSPPVPIADARPAELVRLWQTTGAIVDQILVEKRDRRSRILVMDALTHELDIRQALGLPAPHDHPAMRGTLDLLAAGLGRSIRQRGLPALRIETAGAHWVSGSGEPAATVSAGRYDLYRSMAGRRTHAQIAALAWSRPPDPWLPAFEWGPFHPPAELVEYPLATAAAA